MLISSCHRLLLSVVILPLLLLIANTACSAPPANKSIRPLAREISDRLKFDDRIVVFFQDDSILNPATETAPAYDRVLRNLVDLMEHFRGNTKVSFRWLKVDEQPFSLHGGSLVAKVQSMVQDDYYRKVLQNKTVIEKFEDGVETEWIYVDNTKSVLKVVGMIRDPPEEIGAAAKRILRHKKSRTAVVLGYEGEENGATRTAMSLLEGEKVGEEISVVLAPEYNIYREQGDYSYGKADSEESASVRRSRRKAERTARKLANDEADFVTVVDFSAGAQAERVAAGACR